MNEPDGPSPAVPVRSAAVAPSAPAAAPAPAAPRESQGEAHFRWRGGGVSRIEGLSDGVFALALTLLVVSLEVPRTYAEMVAVFRQIPVFLLTYAMFGWIWYLHHRFHRRFGLEDAVTVTWNLVLLFLVLLYVYPLRFFALTLCRMFGLVGPAADGGAEARVGVTPGEMQGLMLIYGAGFVAVFGCLTVLYRHAWKQRDRLALDARERLLTRAAVRETGLTACVGLASMALTLLGGGWLAIAGMSYGLTGAVHAWSGSRTERALRDLAAAEAGAEA